MKAVRQTRRLTVNQEDRQTGRHIGRQAVRKEGTYAGIQTDKQTDR